MLNRMKKKTGAGANGILLRRVQTSVNRLRGNFKSAP